VPEAKSGGTRLSGTSPKPLAANLTELQGIAAKPGEVLIFARKRNTVGKLNP
jgi:hypothetical protein